MRNRNFCCVSFILVSVFVISLNYFILKTSKPASKQNVRYQKVTFNELQSDASGLYKVWSPFPRHDKPEEDNIDITIATQSSVSNLLELRNLVENWDGFVSVGIFAPGDELEVAVRVIYTMRKCSALIRSNAFFSLVLTLSHPPQYYHDLSVYLKKVSSHPNACQSLKYQDASGSFKRKNYDNNGVPYPVNLLRNVALQNAKTSHVLVIDIDMMPSANLRQDFQNEYHKIKQNNAVYVIPTFELKKGSEMPSDKEKLLQLWKLRKVRPFYESVCWKCQRHTNYDRWRKSSADTISAKYKVDWQDPWEPFFIAETKRIISYDDRFKQYGFNRISQVCETHIAGHNFYVIDQAFLVHDGFKEKSEFHTAKDAENARNRNLYRWFKKRLKLKYKTSHRHC